MRYTSTRGQAPAVCFRDAVLAGLAPDGGLYVPAAIPAMPAELLDQASPMAFSELAFRLARLFTGGDPGDAWLEAICTDAFDFPVPLVELGNGALALELFHGPTLAFKDFGARFLARILGHIVGCDEGRLTILVATSGDTGSAVAHSFAGQEAIDVVLLYPSGRVSELQERQLTTIGGNVTALEVSGTFDECQAMVKTAFADSEVRRRRRLCSANSINIGRLLPQIFYYVHAWRCLARSGSDAMIACVPCGNLGNLTGALLARLMGLPLQRLVVGTNANDVVARYLASGRLEPRPVVATPANAMDVVRPSNLERIRALLGADLEILRSLSWGCSVSTPEILDTMARVHREDGYLLDPHSAVAYRALERFVAAEGQPPGPRFFAATAHPGKFAEAVRRAIGHQVELPPELRDTLTREKRALRISSSPAALKELLLDGSR